MQNDVLPVYKNRIRLAIEEVVQQILFPNLPEPDIALVVEYSETDGNCLVSVDYGGKRFDIHDSENQTSLIMLKNTAESLTYSYRSDEKRPNRVEILIKKG